MYINERSDVMVEHRCCGSASPGSNLHDRVKVNCFYKNYLPVFIIRNSFSVLHSFSRVAEPGPSQ